MNKIIAFFLILVIFGGAIHLDELLKAPVLFRHYTEHKIQHPNDSPISFLYKHYILNQNAESENDGASDSQMPFKSNQCFQSHFGQFIVYMNDVSFLNFVRKKLFFHFIGIDVLSGFLSIWQPPKAI